MSAVAPLARALLMMVLLMLRAWALPTLALPMASALAATDATPYLPSKDEHTNATLSGRPTGPSAEPTLAAELLDGYSHGAFTFNRFVYEGLGGLSGRINLTGGAALAGVGAGMANVVSNLTNEPITILASLLVGDVATATHAARRFAINSTAGFLGAQDRASEWGYAPRHADFGLSLCRMGVGEGGYVVLPFIGPRTVRDGVSDVLLTNLLLWPMVGAVTGGGASLQTIVIAEAVEVAADIVATRQIDPLARRIGLDDYEAMRGSYLAERRLRCSLAADAGG